MKRFKLAYRNNTIISPPSSDLVALGILPKQISEFTVDDIGKTFISIPYMDESGIIIGPIEFEVVGVNHHRDVNDTEKPTITLMSKYILRDAAFDGKESSNPDASRQNCGNNRWSISNIRQWLNSEGVANFWYTSQHEYDAEPNSSNVYVESLPYSDVAGFLAGFNNDIKQHLATVKNKTILCDYDKSSLGKDFEETEDKIFLPSYTEMGFGNLDNNNPEGVPLSNRFIDYISRIKRSGFYWMRSPAAADSYNVGIINTAGYPRHERAYGGFELGIVPLLVLC